MINVEFYRNKSEEIYKFILSGHSDFGEEGNDVVCSAVSVLVINTVNCVEKFTDDGFSLTADEKNGGYLEFEFSEKDKVSHDAGLLIKAMELGLLEIKNEYSCYIKINDGRCSKC